MQLSMTWMDRIALFQPLDYAALAIIFCAWLAIGWRIEHPNPAKPSVSLIMAQYRREWMTQMITRQPRIFDSQMISTLRQSTAFFASTSMIALGGTLALLGNSERLSTVVEDLALTELPTVVWEFKMLLPLFFLTNGFLKFVWSNRLFGYCSVLMAAVPNDPRAQFQSGVAIALFCAGQSGLDRRPDPPHHRRYGHCYHHLAARVHVTVTAHSIGK